MFAPLCFIDTETTGLRRPWARCGRAIWDVAMIRRLPLTPDGHAAEQTMQFFVLLTPEQLADADPFALNIGQFWHRYPATAAIARDRGLELLDLPVAAWRIQEFTAGCHLVGAVPSFDEEGLAHLLYEQCLLPRWHYHLVDVEALAAGRYRLEPPWDSKVLTEIAGVEMPDEDERHTALGDARWAQRLYDAVMAD